MSDLKQSKEDLVTEIESLRSQLSQYKKKIQQFQAVEQALLESEERFRSIFENSTIGMYRSTPEGNILLANPALINMLGYKTFNELAKRNLEENGYEPSYKRSFFKDEMEKNNRVVGIEAVWLKKDRTHIFVRESAIAYRDKNNSIIYYEGTIEDITDYKKALDNLRESEEKLQNIFISSPYAISLTDLNGNIIDCNAAKTKLYGYAYKKLIGKNIDELYAESEKERAHHYFQKLVKKGILKSVELTFKRKNGKEFIGELSGSLIKNRKNKPDMLVAISHDITDRKKIEQELFFKKNLLETFMNHSVDQVYFKNTKSKYISVNKAWANCWARHLGSDPNNVIGLSDFDFFPKGHSEKTRKDELNIIKTGEPLIHKIETLPDGKKGKKYFSTTKMPLYNAEGKIIGTFGISRDLTKQIESEKIVQKSEKKLRELNAMKDRFFSIVAHDLKNPFGSIINFSNLLLANYKKYDKEKMVKYLNAIHETSKQGFSLLENMLEWSLSQTNKIVFNPQNISINSLIEINMNLIEHVAAKKNITLYNELEDNIVACGDPNMISTVIRNILSNAVKFTEPNGSVTIFNKKQKNEIEIHIRDTGVGIPEEDIEKLFRIDEDYSTRGTDNEKGTGLGLIISNEFIKKNKGTIKVFSEENKGSTFIFTLPGKNN